MTEPRFDGRSRLASMPFESTAAKAAAIAFVIILAVGAFFVSRWGFANSASTRADSSEVAEYLVTLAPSDPQTHYAAAVTLEKNFASADIERSLVEYETATALSPNNYHLWLALGRARDRSGDAAGGEKALHRAAELAPSYAQVRWALGNFLVRNDRPDEGFAEIRRAVAADPSFARPAVNTARQILDGDVSKILAALGDSPRIKIWFSTLLAGEKRLDEAINIWRSVPLPDRYQVNKDASLELTASFIEAHRYRDAMAIAAEQDDSIGATGGQITNGGFEQPIKVQNAAWYDWQTSQGTQPQIAPTTSKQKNGANSLVIIFPADGRDFRQFSQIVAVEPGRTYDFEIYYQAEIKTNAELRWT
ncbi:MAG: hypothetical protein ABR535_04720, partial [Pyrinomonadaceae bacterium]